MANPRWTGASSGSWATAANWDQLVAAPVNSDNVFLRNNAVDISTGFNQAAVTLTSLHQEMTFTGKIGLAPQTAKAVTSITRVSSTATLTSTAHGFSNGDAVTIAGATESEYNGTFTISNVTTNTFDYTVTGTPTTPASSPANIYVKLTDYLKIGATTAYLGKPSNSATAGSGSGRIRLDFGTVQNTTYVYNSASSSTDAGEEPIRLTGTHASNKLYVSGGRVGFGMGEGMSGTLSLLSVSGSQAVANVGSGVTLTAVKLERGTATIYCAATTVTAEGGTFTSEGSGAITTVYSANGNAYLNSTGTITTLEVQNGGHANFLNSKAARTVTTLKLYKGATLSYDPSVVTITNPIQLIGCTLEDVTINTPPGLTVAVVKT